MSDHSIENLFGGVAVLGHALSNQMDYYTLAQEGLPKEALLHLMAHLNLSVRATATLLNITQRTIQRKQDHDLLDASTSEQLIQIAEVYARGIGVFGSSLHFQTWMNLENKALGGKKPLELLRSRYGAQMILEVIGRIEHGIYS